MYVIQSFKKIVSQEWYSSIFLFNQFIAVYGHPALFIDDCSRPLAVSFSNQKNLNHLNTTPLLSSS